MSEFEKLSAELADSSRRFDRAFAWATRGRWVEPWQVSDPAELEAIEALKDRIREVGPEAAWDEYLGGKW